MIPGRPPEIVGLVDKLSLSLCPGFPRTFPAFAFRESRHEIARNTRRNCRVYRQLPGISFSLIQCSKNAGGVTSTYDFMPRRAERSQGTPATRISAGTRYRVSPVRSILRTRVSVTWNYVPSRGTRTTSGLTSRYM